MAQADILREFLVQLGFKVDEAQQRKFIDSIEVATVRVAEFALALEAAAVAVVVTVVKMAEGLNKLHFESERTRASVANIKAMEYAYSQLGATADEVASALTNIAQTLRTNPGAG